MGKTRGYSFDCDKTNTSRSKIYAPVHFKNTVQLVKPMHGMTLKRANRYLKNVIAQKECVPFTKFKKGVGRCAQAKAFKTTQGRWPQKSVKILLSLLQNATSNAEYQGIDCESLSIVHVQANPAVVSRRRTFRAHGRIAPYTAHHSYVELVLGEKK